MRLQSILLALVLSGCGFSPLYKTTQNASVCVASIPEHNGYVLYQELTNRFTGTSPCQYTLKVDTPAFSFSDLGISDHSFTTMQRIQVKASYTLENAKHTAILRSTAMAEGSSAIVNNPYASVVARETNQNDLLKILANRIETHISTFLLKDSP